MVHRGKGYFDACLTTFPDEWMVDVPPTLGIEVAASLEKEEEIGTKLERPNRDPDVSEFPRI